MRRPTVQLSRKLLSWLFRKPMAKRHPSKPELKSITPNIRITVLPEIRELGFLPANAEDRGPGTKLAPTLPSETPQLSQRCVQALTHNLTAAQPDLVDAMRLCGISAISHVVDQKYPYLGQRQIGFTRPLLNQVRWRHDQARKRSSGAMHQHA